MRQPLYAAHSDLALLCGVDQERCVRQRPPRHRHRLRGKRVHRSEGEDQRKRFDMKFHASLLRQKTLEAGPLHILADPPLWT